MKRYTAWVGIFVLAGTLVSCGGGGDSSGGGGAGNSGGGSVATPGRFEESDAGSA